MPSRVLMLLAALPLAFGCPKPTSVGDDSDTSTAGTAFTAIRPGSQLRTTHAVNLRSGPSSQASVEDVLDEGVLVSVKTGVLNEKWLEVTSAERQGWVFAPFLSFDACLKLDLAASHLRNALQNCSGEGDSNVYGFSRTSCEAASAQCSNDEMGMLLSTASCDVAAVPVCATGADRDTVVQAIYACAESANGISWECLSGLSP